MSSSRSSSDDIDLEALYETPLWTEAHACFPEEVKKRPYEDLYELAPLWLYAKTCLEDEEETGEVAARATTNGTSTINHLPRDVLAQIFEHLAIDARHAFYSSNDTPSSSFKHPYSWLNITLVCRHWRNTAYSHPVLWIFIDLAYGKELVRSLLILSEDEALHIYTNTFPGLRSGAAQARGVTGIGEYEIKLDLVMDEQKRMGDLRMRLASTKFVKLIPWKQFVRNACPRLEVLSLMGGVDVKAERRVLLPLVEVNLPRLRVLVLDGLCPRWEGMILPAQLRRLEIYNVHEAECTPVEFVRCLARCTELRTLKIDCFSLIV